MASVAVVVVVAIEMAVSTILVLAFEEGGNVMLWRASAMVRIILFSRNNNNERKAGGGNHDFLIILSNKVARASRSINCFSFCIASQMHHKTLHLAYN